MTLTKMSCRCPDCNSKFILSLKYDDLMAICMNCKSEWMVCDNCHCLARRKANVKLCRECRDTKKQMPSLSLHEFTKLYSAWHFSQHSARKTPSCSLCMGPSCVSPMLVNSTF